MTFLRAVARAREREWNPGSQSALSAARRGSTSVPRLSIIVPFLRSESRLESTLLSVLENRPKDCEIVLVHDGSYHDPYDLANDELVVVETESPSVVAQMNEGIFAACSPNITFLMPGDRVEEGWEREATQELQNQDIAAVLLPIQDSSNDQAVAYGLSTSMLPRRVLGLNAWEGAKASPTLHGSFFRRRFLLSLGGLLDCGSFEAAEIDLGLAIQALGLRTKLVDSAVIRCEGSLKEIGKSDFQIGQCSGRLANAYSKVPNSHVCLESLVGRLSQLAGGLLSPSSVADRMGWVLGCRDASLAKPVAQRIARAFAQLHPIVEDSAKAVHRAA